MDFLDQKKLKNGVVITSYDDSKSIVGDRWMVRIRFAITVPWAQWMDDILEKEGGSPELIQNGDGDLLLELQKERIFVEEESKDVTAAEIIAEMHQNILVYLAQESFVKKFFRKSLDEAKEKLMYAGVAESDEVEDDDDSPADFSACFRDD